MRDFPLRTLLLRGRLEAVFQAPRVGVEPADSPKVGAGVEAKGAWPVAGVENRDPVAGAGAKAGVALGPELVPRLRPPAGKNTPRQFVCWTAG